MNKKSIVMLGATGAVGTEVVKELAKSSSVKRLTLLGRRPLEGIALDSLEQHKIDIFNSSSYVKFLTDHDTAICTLGVGEPSKVSNETFLKIDKNAVIDFAKACKSAGVEHFELLASVGIDAKSRSFYLRTKGELVEELEALNFDRLSIFKPSMIITPTNRYGFSQALTLVAWPVIDKVFFGGLKKFKGIKVSELGIAIALNVFKTGRGTENLEWSDF